MTLAFILTMPGRGSWNGEWSGEGNTYALFRSFTSKNAKAKAEKLLLKGSFSYGWNDGWRASIEVKEVSGFELRKMRKQSQGFCGYEWMVESILMRGTILAAHEIKMIKANENRT